MFIYEPRRANRLRPDTNRAVQPKKTARNLKIRGIVVLSM